MKEFFREITDGNTNKRFFVYTAVSFIRQLSNSTAFTQFLRIISR